MKRHTPCLASVCATTAVVLLTVVPAQAQQDAFKSPSEPLVIANQGYFFVNGKYFTAPSGQIIADQMYVEFQIPQNVKHPYPIVMIHGGGQTGTNFMGTPDGREGWGQFFLRQGYAVYIVDQVARAKSGWQVDVYGPIPPAGNAGTVQQRFTAIERFNLWPQAHLHTQWPGSGMQGDPIFDQFLASQVPSLGAGAEALQRAAEAALLDRIGPAIVVTHSQSGPFGWVVGDARPSLVKGIVAVEPSGPPFYNVNQIGPPTWFTDGPLSRPWGITSTPITYAPPVTDPSQLTFVQQTTPDNPDVVRCRLQTEPARQITTLARIPIVIITSEASYHASYDHCTSKYLTQAGVRHTFIRLEDVGIHGNGHMMMLEKDNLQIAQVIAGWLRDNVEKGVKVTEH